MKKKGFTLMEIMASIAIIAILAALIFPAFQSAQKSAFRTSELSNMRQIGIGAQLYTNDSDRRTLLVDTLVTNNYIPKTLCTSQLDPISEGIGNNVAKGMHARLSHFNHEVGYRLSFVSYVGFGRFPVAFEALVDKPNLGWMVSTTEATPKSPGDYIAVTGKFRRLLLDGSVINRIAGPTGVDVDGVIQPVFVADSYFYDLTKQEISSIANEK